MEVFEVVIALLLAGAPGRRHHRHTAFERVEEELDWAELDWTQLLRAG